ncbi:PIN domain-containing protein [Sphingomonas gilva]|uniref:PIN domain-containing protein n=1 Tax=Sphingomonas gilva TaxID=2305907 RepID=A0A396RN06_9SPHN|nr:PIN domain-containing protein [Sphingomonas gilva]RHW17810.1 PIN domain-containing protein [Sphingomonas gilva]
MRRAFFDSNVLLYGYAFADPRSLRAQAILEEGGAISVQCLNEFASVARRKLGMGFDRIGEALSIVTGLCHPILPLDTDLHRLGLMIADEKRLSVYDGMIVAAAFMADCDILYSEDMQHGLVIDGRLRIVNPFHA